MSQTPEKSKQKIPGRPRKFAEASRPVTVTLPHRTLQLLRSVHHDRAQAIATVTDWATREDRDAFVDIVEVQGSQAVIVVGPSRCLTGIPWLRLVEIAPARFLLVIPSGTAIETLEVAVLDLLDSLSDDDEYERALLTKLRDVLTSQRRTERVSKAEILLLDRSRA